MRRIEIIYKKTAELIPFAGNPRKNDATVAGLASSIKRFGFKVPITIEEDGTICTGHTRYKAALLLGLEEVPCVLNDDLTEEENDAFRLVDNKVSEKSEWDQPLLDIELRRLCHFDWGEFDIVFPEMGITDAEKEWDGMPEFQSEDQLADNQLIVNFKTLEDRADFAQLIGQKLTPKTRSVWHPQALKNDNASLAYVEESE